MAGVASSQFPPNTVFDAFSSFELGMNGSENPLILPPNQLAYGSNLTVRGTFAQPRPPRRTLALNFNGNTALQTAVTKGLFQGATYYKPDNGVEVLIASISGRLFRFTPIGTVATVDEITGGNPQSATALQAWLWQAEHWVIWNDGINLPVFFNGTTTTRSRGSAGSQPPMYAVATSFTGIGPGTPITLTYAFTGANGDSVILSPGTGSDKQGVVVSGAGTTHIVVNFAITNASYFVGAGAQLLDTAASVTSVAISQAVVVLNNYTTATPLVFNLVSAYTGSANVIISNGTIFPIRGTVTAGIGTNILHITLDSLDNTGAGIYFGPNINIPVGQLVTDTVVAPQAAALPPQFPPGRMGAYGRGRIWMSLADGKQFVAGDIVGGASGTAVENFRDAILNITENQFLVGGGNFTVPGSVGDIRAMIFTATLDASLGQGPLQVLTPTHVFSCNAPVDRLTWQSLTNPILTESAIGNGGLGQPSTFNANSDIIMRSIDGMRSLKLSREDFNLWLRTPMSHEVERVLNQDNQALLPWTTGAFFDNRILMSASPIATASNGVYSQAIVALNTDPISNLNEKKPPVFDGAWPGMNVMQLVVGLFSLVERCYQIVWNPVLEVIELWELMPQSAADVQNNPAPIVGDNGNQPIEFWFESPALFRENISKRTFKELFNGELIVSDLVGTVEFEVFWKPDQWPCWVPWLSWQECAKTGSNNKPAFKPRMGLGSPSSTPCDTYNNRPLKQGYTFQIKVYVRGQCTIIGARFAAVVIPEPLFAAPSCNPVC